MDRLMLYVPVEQFGAHGIVPGSAIVARDDRESDSDPLLVHYEGNMYGATNLESYLDRALCAAGRLLERYPTTAKMAAAPDELMFVGYLDYEQQRIDIEGLGSDRALAGWLGYGDRSTVPTEEITRRP